MKTQTFTVTVEVPDGASVDEGSVGYALEGALPYDVHVTSVEEVQS